LLSTTFKPLTSKQAETPYTPASLSDASSTLTVVCPTNRSPLTRRSNRFLVHCVLTAPRATVLMSSILLCGSAPTLSITFHKSMTAWPTRSSSTSADGRVEGVADGAVDAGAFVDVGEGSSGLQADRPKVAVRSRTTGTKRPFLRNFVIVFHS